MRRQHPAEEQDAGPVGEPTLGGTLRAAREAQNMTAQDVAAKLKLNTDIVTALEEGVVDRLPAPTYVRGYIRSYARMMGLDPVSMILQYDRNAGAPPDIEPQHNMPEPQARASDLPVKVMTYLVIIVLLVLTAMGLLQTYQQSLLSSLSLPKWAGEGVTAGAPPASASRPASGKVTPAPSPPAAPQPPTLSYTYPVLTEAGLTPAQAAALAAPATPSPAAVTEATPPEARSPTVQAAGTTTAVAPLTTAEAGILNMEVSADSWIDVFDNTGSKLYFNMAHNGDRITAQGALPYRVRIGRMSAVRLNFRGVPLDVSAYTQDGVAHFMLTDQGVAPP